MNENECKSLKINRNIFYKHDIWWANKLMCKMQIFGVLQIWCQSQVGGVAQYVR